MYNIYTIKKGDTLTSVAQDFNTTVATLYEINSFTPNYTLKENSKIIVPLKQEKTFDYYTIKTGDTLSSIANSNNIDINTLITLNGIEEDDFLYPEQIILVPRENINLYITKDSDTIDEVAKKLNITPIDILLQNRQIYLLPDQLVIYKSL